MNRLSSFLQKQTFHHADYADIARLVTLKKKRGVSISLCFPTLNEEYTIGESIATMRSELMERVPLLDEIAVIDSGSSDRTLEIANECGAKTFVASDHLPAYGDFRGKGANLWKALYLLKGDILVFIDADIQNIHPRFVYGLIGPLLTQQRIRFVKAFYNRPFLESSGNIHPTGGGRVTEILVRPLFAHFFPDLCGIVQPLSGEFAGYRDIFAHIPFPSGYGVETGMLIDIYQQFSLSIVGQTNLDIRIHRNHDTAKLGRMSFAILQTLWNRLNKYKEGVSLHTTPTKFSQIALENSQCVPYEFDIYEHDYPPMHTIAEYQNRK